MKEKCKKCGHEKHPNMCERCNGKGEDCYYCHLQIHVKGVKEK